MTDQENNKEKVNIQDSKNIAEQNYHPTKKQQNTDTKKGLSETNKQVQNQYYEGTVDRDTKE